MKRPHTRVTESATNTNVRIEVHTDATERPTETFETHNTTRDRYHEAIIGELDGFVSDLQVDQFVLGDSTAATSTIPAGDVVGNELFRTDTIDTSRSGQTFTATVFIDTTEGNGLTFEEGGLSATQPDGSDLPIQRFLINDPGGLLSPKSQGESVTIEVEITQSDA
jgi:hypothetical protein